MEEIAWLYDWLQIKSNGMYIFHSFTPCSNNDMFHPICIMCVACKAFSKLQNLKFWQIL